jgi:hypothetical protein
LVIVVVSAKQSYAMGTYIRALLSKIDR